MILWKIWKGAAEIGMKAEHVKLPSSISERDLIDKISELNGDSSGLDLK